jgi:hypothetical protein
MSYKMNTKIQLSEKKPFCKMCFDAKRPGYDTHYLKDFSGPSPKVVCPYLLSLQCNYCKQEGHTISYCPILKEKEGYEEETSKNVKKSIPTKSSLVPSAAIKQNPKLLKTQTKTNQSESASSALAPAPTKLYKLYEENTQTQKVTKMLSSDKIVRSGNNQFLILVADEDEEDEEEEEKIIPIPTPTPVSAPTTVAELLPVTESRVWADIAAKIPIASSIHRPSKSVQFKELTITIPHPPPPIQISALPASASASAPSPASLPELPQFNLKKKTPLLDAFFKYDPKRSWADDSSEDEEE